MEESVLSVDVEHDYLPEWNRMLPLPKSKDEDETVAWFARGTRLRLWRSGPRKADELRPAAEAEVAEAVDEGMIAADDAADMIDRVCLILASDASIADPPSIGHVEDALEESRTALRRLWRPLSESDKSAGHCVESCPFDVDRYGNFPGVNWRAFLGWALSRVCRWPHTNLRLPTSYILAWEILRDEVTRDAEAIAAGEESERRERSDLAVASLPAVFEGDQQRLLCFLWRLRAGGDFVDVPTDGNPVAEAELLRQVRAFDIYGMTMAQQAEVADQLMRVVATAEADKPLIVPGLGYAIKVQGKTIVDVFPGNLTLTIEGRDHVLASPELSRPVRLSAREFRDPRLCARAIYEQVFVEVDNPRGHWRKWWPVLAERLRKTARVVEGAERVEGWTRFVAGVDASAVESSYAMPDGGPYRAADGKVFVGKGWLVERALAAGVIAPADRKAFSDWLGKAERNRRDAAGRQHKVLAIGEHGPLVIEANVEPVVETEVAGSSGANMP